MATKPTIKAKAADWKKELVEKLREIEKTARHAADPREPAEKIAAALIAAAQAGYFEQA